MKGQAKTHTMRIFISGQTDKETGKKVADFTFRYTIPKVWEGATSAGLYRTAAISAQQTLRKEAEKTNKDGSRSLSDSELVTFANSITYSSVDPDTDFKRGKTDVEKYLDLHNKMSPEEQAEAGKLIKAQNKEGAKSTAVAA